MNLLKGKILITVIITAIFTKSAEAQTAKEKELYNIIKSKDSLLFEVGFNQCQLEVFQELLPEDFEFYHDKEGVTSSKKNFMQNLKTNVCDAGNNNVKRILVEESMQVFPLYDHGSLYGAIQIGQHSFGSTIAKFTTLWRLDLGEWKPTRIMSYDHKPITAPIISNVSFVNLTLKEMSIYLGEYEFSPEFTLSIIVEGDKLFGVAQGQKVEIRGYGNHRFLDQSQTMKLEFMIDEKGQVTGLKMTSRDNEMLARKKN